MKYLFKKLAPLIILYIASGILVIGGFTGVPLFGFFRSYFGFATFVIGAGILAHFFGEALPRKFCYKKFPFAPYGWEKNGRIYAKVGVDKWKDRTVDMGKAGVGTESKDLSGKAGGSGRPTPENLEKMIQETCVAEVTHFVLILISPVILFLCELPWSVILLIAYIISNLSDIIIQRYNRPRLIKLLQLMQKKSRTKPAEQNASES